MNKQKTKNLALLAFFITLECVLAIVPFLGFIPLGFINATTLHIPVIVAALWLGPKEGAMLGLVFGLSSVLKATFAANLTSFVFSPFIEIGGVHGNLWSLVIAIIPRVLIGLTSGYLYKLFKHRNLKDTLSIGISAAVGALTNTLLVLGGIYIFFGPEYANALGVQGNVIIFTLLGLLASSGLAEAGVAVVFSTLIMKATQAFRRSDV